MASLRPSARTWLRAAALVGLGQQVFVVLRNQYLLELHLEPRTVAYVQGAGAAAGIVAGLAGLWALRALRARTALLLGVGLNATGFAVQVGASGAGTMIAGAAVAGLGIQALTMTTGPFLATESAPADRVRLFALSTLLLQAAPGAIGALVAGQVHRLAGDALASSVAGYRVALGVGLVSVVVGMVPLLFLDPEARIAPPGEPRERGRLALGLQEPGKVVRLLLPDALLYFGNGLIVPFLQIYLKQRFGLAPASIGALYAALMITGSAGHLLSPLLARRFGTWPVIVGSQLLSLPIFATLLLTEGVEAAAVAFVLRQALINLAAPLTTSLIHGSVSPADASPLAAYRMLAQSVAWAGANFAAGPLIAADPREFRPVLIATLVAYVLSIASALGVYPRAARAAGADRS